MKLAIAMASVLFLTACGGDERDSERVLHLRTGDYTEAELRAEMRAIGFSEAACDATKGLSAVEVRDILVIDAREGDASKPVVQEADPEDDIRQGEILLEECDRLY